MNIIEDVFELLSDGIQRKATDISRELKVDLPIINEVLAFLTEYNLVRRGHDGSYVLDEEVKRILDIES
ncbi:MAG: hypothetical protein WHS82_05340 [Candidatus Methanosuratincola sp.]